MKNIRTLKETNPEEYKSIELLYATAIDAMLDPEYEKTAPPPRG